ncbi:MAG: DUF1707 domain-containing protein [Streptosporangiaceae bacterium]
MRGHPYRQYARQAQQAQQWLVTQNWAGPTAEVQLRIGDSERTQVTEALQQHYAEGRLDSDELEERLEATLAAKTRADLREITKDLPGPRAWEAVPHPPRRPHGVHHGHQVHHRGGRFLKTPLILLAVLGIVAVATGTPVVFFVALRVVLTIALLGFLFGFLRRRRYSHR